VVGQHAGRGAALLPHQSRQHPDPRADDLRHLLGALPDRERPPRRLRPASGGL
ncbi:MAG: hypothetical protein AVDCRST_MAG59-3357, partial [uncultured Thermomicrobiales bacterium]